MQDGNRRRAWRRDRRVFAAGYRPAISMPGNRLDCETARFRSLKLSGGIPSSGGSQRLRSSGCGSGEGRGSAMIVTVLGSAAAGANAGSGCAGYLVRSEGTTRAHRLWTGHDRRAQTLDRCTPARCHRHFAHASGSHARPGDAARVRSGMRPSLSTGEFHSGCPRAAPPFWTAWPRRST